MLLQKGEVEQRHLHLVQIVENLNLQKLQYTQQCEELSMEIKKLRTEVRAQSSVVQNLYDLHQTSKNTSIFLEGNHRFVCKRPSRRP